MIEENEKGLLVSIKKILPYTPYQDEVVFVDSTHTFKIETWRIEYYKDMLSEKLNVDDSFTGNYFELVLEILKNPQLWEGFSDDEIQEIKDNIICNFDFREYIVDWTQRDIKPSLFVFESVSGSKYNFRQYVVDGKGLFEVLDVVLRSIKHNEYEESLTYDSEEGELEDLQTKVERLENIIKACKDKMRELGVPSDVLESIINNERKTPILFISSKNDIQINGQVVHMAPLDKAVYFLYLNHPEGINFSYLPDYREELLAIYRKLMNYRTSDSMIRSVNDVTDPTQNSINEKCARIRKAFVSILGKYWAEPYCISGIRGEIKKITLDRSLVITEEAQKAAEMERKKELRRKIHSSIIQSASTTAIKWAIENSLSLTHFNMMDRRWCFNSDDFHAQWWEFDFSESKVQYKGQTIGTYIPGNIITPMTLNLDEDGIYRLISILSSNNNHDYRAIFLSEDGEHIIAPSTNPKMVCCNWTLERDMTFANERKLASEQQMQSETSDDLPF